MYDYKYILFMSETLTLQLSDHVRAVMKQSWTTMEGRRVKKNQEAHTPDFNGQTPFMVQSALQHEAYGF